MITFLTAGESHGKQLTVIIEGLPSGIPISLNYIKNEMQKRKKGVGSGGRQIIEDDEVVITSGLRFGKTIGSPLTLTIENKDFKNWENKMSVNEIDEKVKNSFIVKEPRPGHADLAGYLKYIWKISGMF